jgi:GAF domain-containing protein
MTLATLPPAVGASKNATARVGVVNFRDGGCASLVRGLEDLGFTSVRAAADGSMLGPVHMLVFAVSELHGAILSSIREYRTAADCERTPILVISDRFDESDTPKYLEADATEHLNQMTCTLGLRKWCERILDAQQEDWLFDQWVRERRRNTAFDRVIVPLGVALFAERDYGHLLELILLEAKAFCVADGGTLYVRNAEDQLEFTMVHNDTLGISEGGSKGPVTRFAPLSIYRAETGEPDHRYVATHVALTGKAVNLPDVYQTDAFDLSGAKQFDAQRGYRTQSVLAMPLLNQHERVIGVLQLINARDPMTGALQPFDAFQEETISSLAQLAGSGLESFQRMNALREKIHALHLEIDETKKQAQVAQITGSEYFQGLKGKARVLRDRVRNSANG